MNQGLANLLIINASSSFERLIRFTLALSAGFAYGTANEPGDAEKSQALLGRTDSLVLSMI